MTMCSNRPEGFGPKSHLYSHILTSCFLDTVLIPLCTWLYLLTVITLLVCARHSAGWFRAPSRDDHSPEKPRVAKRSVNARVFLVLYYLLILAQVLMCVLEIVRLSLARLGVGLLPFTIVTLVVAGFLLFTRGFARSMNLGCRWVYWANVGVFVALAIANGVKIVQEVKEGTGARKGTKYPIIDEITDVSVMVGVYAALIVLETILFGFNRPKRRT